MPDRPAPPRPAPPPSPGRGGRPARLRPAEKARLRRVLRVGLAVVVVAEALALVVAFSPEARAWTVIVANMAEASIPLNSIDAKMTQANRHLAEIDRNTLRSRDLADRHSQPYGGGAWDPALAAVTATPMGVLQGGLSVSDASASANLATLVPGAVPWRNYHAEYQASADATLLTLRSSLDALNKHYEQIQDDSRLQDLASQAHSADSYLAMDELQVQSQLEVARQLHALRAQQALSTNLYAVAESHRIGAEARTNAKDSQANCKILGAVFGGVAEPIVNAAFCN